MSDTSLYQAAKDNWAQLAVATVVIGVIGGIYMEWRIEAIVTAQLKGTNAAAAITSANLPRDPKIIKMDTATAANTLGVSHNKDNADSFENRLELAFEQLFGRPPERDDD